MIATVGRFATRGGNCRRWKGWGHFASCTLVLFASACGSEATPPPVGRVAAVDPAIDVTVARVERGSIAQAVLAAGSLVARRETLVGAEVRARIVRVHVAEGDRVAAGDPLFAVEASAYEMALRQATAGVDVAVAERRQLEADLVRARQLRKQQVVPEQEIERIATALEVARAGERQAREAVALASYNLEQTVVRAPYAGSIAARLADEGTTALVQPQTIVVVLQETAELEARAAIPESQLALVQVGDTARVLVEGIAEPIATTVSAVSDTIDPATRTYLVKMRVANPDYSLKAGVFAQVEILPSAKTDVLRVPRDAIRTEDGRTRVLVVEEERATAAPVELGIVTDEFAEVVSGVAEGVPVIVGREAGIIAPGMRVRVVLRTPEAVS